MVYGFVSVLQAGSGSIGVLLSDTISLLTYNLIVAISGAIVAGTKHNDSYLVTMGFAIAYFILFIPGSMVCWYIPVYRAYRSVRRVAVFHANIFL